MQVISFGFRICCPCVSFCYFISVHIVCTSPFNISVCPPHSWACCVRFLCTSACEIRIYKITLLNTNECFSLIIDNLLFLVKGFVYSSPREKCIWAQPISLICVRYNWTQFHLRSLAERKVNITKFFRLGELNIIMSNMLECQTRPPIDLSDNITPNVKIASVL